MPFCWDKSFADIRTLYRYVEIGEADALGGHAVDAGRVDLLGSVAAEVLVALIVDEDEDEVRGRFSAAADVGQAKAKTDKMNRRIETVRMIVGVNRLLLHGESRLRACFRDVAGVDR